MSTSVSNDYSPSYIVRQSHNILHLDSSLGEVSNDFAITYDSQWNDYSRSLLPVPIICGALGVTAIVILQLSICFRMCCKSCRCLPRIRTSRAGGTELFDRDTLPRYRVLCFVFLAFAVIIILTNQMLLFGNRYLTEGVDTSHNGINFLQDLTTTLTNEGNDLLTYGDVLQSELESASSTCAPASSLATGVSTQYDSYVNDYLGYVQPIPGRCDDANNGLDTWEYYKNTSLWALYAAVWLIIVTYTIGIFFKQRCLLQIGLGFTQFVMLVIFFIIGTLMVILIGYGDFCMDPITYTGGLLPRDIYNVTAYYLDCQGVNPITGDLNDAYQFVDGYYTYISSLYSGVVPGCAGNTYLQQSLTELTTINATLNEISVNIVCPPIQSQLSDVLQTGLCTQGFEGIYTIWLGNYITTSCLLVATILISLIYQYFGQYWGGDVEEHNDDIIIVNENPALFADVQLTHQSNGNDSPNEFYYNTSTLHKEPPLSA